MSQILIQNLTFGFLDDALFDNVSLSIDTNFKLGLIGRNGRGKTTLLKLLQGKFEHEGKISSSVDFDYFPYIIQDTDCNVYELAQVFAIHSQQWMIDCELNLLQLSKECRCRPYKSLSGGEQTKVLLALLFLKNDNFLLIDEPTNHLDTDSRKTVSDYLKAKKGFILVSHDRSFLDGCVDHILVLNKKKIELQKGNFSSYEVNKEKQDNFEISQNQKLVSEIERLKTAAKQKNDWSNLAESKKSGAADKGFMGAKAARAMKTAKIIEKRQEKAIDDKLKLLKDIETADDLTLNYHACSHKRLVFAQNLALSFDSKVIFENLNFQVLCGDRIAICGKNGTGKTSLLKTISGFYKETSGKIDIVKGIKVSYVDQDISKLFGTPKEFIKEDKEIDCNIYFAILAKLGLDKSNMDTCLSKLSPGQKKKVVLAKSISQPSHIYLWDEPLNYIDILSRMQVQQMVLKSSSTMVFIEHDKAFCDAVATNKIELT
ncbi:MAG: ABC-F type ribosomal protection protein [Clostridiales bacterium]|jgi:lincosamide and streptogramin A transport system ATP-binding/permease protein|nr:ABC-F type ribosomal protection protein [Clostridiales bacterium]